jgi:hypothetical protein
MAYHLAMRPLALALALAVLTAACGGDDGAGVPDTAAPGVTVDISQGLVLNGDGLQAVPFGAAPDDAVEAVGVLLGRNPDVDTGWIDPTSAYGTCPGSELPAVEFGDLVVLFSDAISPAAPQGGRHFYSYTYRAGRQGPEGLLTLERVGLGDTVNDLELAYGADLVLDDEDLSEGAPRWSVESGGGSLLSGLVGDTTPAGIVLSINGGLGCAGPVSPRG